MSVEIVNQPFPHFTDDSGEELDNGYIYIGTAGSDPESNPITVYWDQALTIPASQPLRTVNGYISRNGSASGSPSRVWVGVDYSIKIKDRRQVAIYTSLEDNNELAISGSTQSFATVADLIASTTVSIGAHVLTKEYSTGSGGGNRYEIVAAGTGTDDGGSYIDLSGSGFQAKALWYNDRPNAKQFGATGDGTTDDKAAFDAYVSYAISTGSKSIWIPLSNGEIYRLSGTVAIESSNFQIAGDATLGYLPQNVGHVLCDGDFPAFDYGNGQSGFSSNQFSVIGVNFYKSGSQGTTAAVNVNMDGGTHRGFLFRHCSCTNFADFVKFTSPTSSIIYATATFDACVSHANTNMGNAENPVFGLRVTNCQSEQGSKFTGMFDTGINFDQVMLEGQSDTLNFDGNRPNVNIENCYFELNSGDYLVNVSPAIQGFVRTRPNYITKVTATDILRIGGFNQIVEDQPFGQFDILDDGTYPDRNAWITLYNATAIPGSRLSGNHYAPTVDSNSRSFGLIDSGNLMGRRPTGALTSNLLQEVDLETPYGRTFTGATINAFPATYFSITDSYTTGDMITAVALVRVESGSEPYLQLYDDAFAVLTDGFGGTVEISDKYDGQWFLLFGHDIAKTTNSTIRFRFGSNGTGASSVNLHIAAIGSVVTAAADFETLNSTSRALIKLFNPFPSADSGQLLTSNATDIADMTSAVNTQGKANGRTVYDDTNKRLMVADNSGPTDNWNVVDGSASVTPS
jgi:hypothetical protein